MKYGEPLVESCVRFGTDYVDSTGETPFIRNIIDKYHEKAVGNSTRLVPSCGFDSIPSDLGAYLYVFYCTFVIMLISFLIIFN